MGKIYIYLSIVNYIDAVTGEPRTEEVKVQFIARPKYYAEDKHEVISEIPFETNIIYDDQLDAGTVKRIEGEVGEKKTVYEWSFDSSAEKPENRVVTKTKETTTKAKKDAEIRIGIRPVEATVSIPRTVEVEVDPNMELTDEPVVVEGGNDGVVTVKTLRDPITEAITITKETTTEAKPKKVKVGTKTTGTVIDEDEISFGVVVEIDQDFYKNYPDAKENYKVITEDKAPTKRKIKVVSKTEGEITDLENSEETKNNLA